jgi:hypothetical protein
MTTDEAIEFVATTVAAHRPDWSLEQCREMVGLARKTIATNPQKFVDTFLDDMNIHEQNRKEKECREQQQPG